MDGRSSGSNGVVEALRATRDLAAKLGRDDLVQRLAAARARIERPSTIVCVVGEFKQGKSSLINAALGARVCPIDDDLATSVITLVRFGAEVSVLVRRRAGGGVITETIAPGDLANWVTEAGNHDNVKGVERVDIAVPSPLLDTGLALVDTPGMGGLGAGHTAATLAFLPFADGLIFVSDATAELSGPESDFLRRASDLCPTVLFALTKTDLHPHWERIAELDRDHLTKLGSEAHLVPVSSSLRSAALGRKDRALDDMSGFPLLLQAVRDKVLGPAKTTAVARGVADAVSVLDQVGGAARSELSVLRDPERRPAAVAELDRARQRLEVLKGPGSRWNVLVADKIGDLNSESSYRFRGAMRTITRSFEDQIEVLKTPKEWEDLSRLLQTHVADAVTDVFSGIEAGAQAIREAVVEVLAEESLDLPPFPGRQGSVDPSTLWRGKPAEVHRARVSTAITGLRGAQSGIVMFGMMSRFLPGAVASLLALTPVTLGIGAAFAGMQFMDAHKRKIQQRRMAARTNVRQFLDDVQFEVGNELNDALREVQRRIRDEFTERMAELQRTYSELYHRAQTAAERDQAGAEARRVELEAVVVEADRCQAALEAVGE